MANLTWDDLFVDASVMDLGALLRMWPGTVRGTLRPLGSSAFGDIYFERPEGRVERLDLLEGGVFTVAGSAGEFAALMNDVAWQEANLLSQGVALLIEKGLVRAAHQCYGFAPHPALVGRVDFAAALVLDAPVWHSICSQLLDPAVAHASAEGVGE